MSMNDKEKEDCAHENAFIFTRVSLQLAEAALTAANYGMGLDAFERIAEDTYLEAQVTLESLRARMRSQLDQREAEKQVEDAKIENDSKGG